MSNQPEFNVLVRRKQHPNGISVDIHGARFLKTENEMGVADSLDAMHGAGLVSVPMYMPVQGRGHVGNKEDPVWSWHDTLSERGVAKAEKSYEGIPNGVYVFDLQGAAFYMANAGRIRAAIGDGTLQSGAGPLTEQDKDMLFGERMAYVWEDGEVKPVSVEILPSYDAFLERSKDPHFLGNVTRYVVLRDVDEARANPSGYRPIEEQFDNPDLVIPSGGKAPLKGMLEKAQSFGWKRFGSHHDGYGNVDTARRVVLNFSSYGVDANGNLGSNGGSLGVAPEALELARSATTLRETQQSLLETRVATAVNRGRAFEFNGKVYAPVQAPNLALTE